MRATTASSPAPSRCSRASRGRGGAGRADPPRAGPRAPQGAGHRRHRHRRRGQVEPHGRAARAPGAPFPAGADRGGGDGPDPAPQRRGAARGPHPHEQPRRRERLHALARHAPRAPGDRGGAQGRDRAVQGGRLRPRHRRDRRHRPVRHRDRRSRGPVAVRDDERVRRREPAREDRHARLRRLHRAQQEREARRRGQPARRAQAVAPQSPRQARLARRRGAGVPDHRQPLQRPGRQSAVRRRCARRSSAKRVGTAAWRARRSRSDRAQLRARRWCPGRAPATSPRSPRAGREARARIEAQVERGAPRLRPLRGAEVAARCGAAGAA